MSAPMVAVNVTSKSTGSSAVAEVLMLLARHQRLPLWEGLIALLVGSLDRVFPHASRLENRPRIMVAFTLNVPPDSHSLASSGASVSGSSRGSIGGNTHLAGHWGTFSGHFAGTHSGSRRGQFFSAKWNGQEEAQLQGWGYRYKT